MVEYSFEPWEAILPQGTPKAFRCPNLECSIVYVTGGAEGLYTLERRTLKPYSKAAENAPASFNLELSPLFIVLIE